MEGIRHYRTDLAPGYVRGLVDNGEEALSLTVAPYEADYTQQSLYDAEERELTIGNLHKWKLGEVTVRVTGLTTEGTAANVMIPRSDSEPVTIDVVDIIPYSNFIDEDEA